MHFRRVSPEEAQEALGNGEGWRVLDVRTPEEFEAGHIAGAVNIPIAFYASFGLAANPDFLSLVDDQFGRDAKLITFCRRGVRSMRAAELLASSGYREILDIRGGMDGEVDATGALSYPGWEPRGLPVER